MGPNMICIFRKGKSHIKTETQGEDERGRHGSDAAASQAKEYPGCSHHQKLGRGKERLPRVSELTGAHWDLTGTASLQICAGVNFRPFKLCSGQYFVTAPLGNQYKDQICFLAFFSLWQPPHLPFLADGSFPSSPNPAQASLALPVSGREHCLLSRRLTPLLLSSSTFKGPCDYTQHSQIIQDDFPIFCLLTCYFSAMPCGMDLSSLTGCWPSSPCNGSRES